MSIMNMTNQSLVKVKLYFTSKILSFKTLNYIFFVAICKLYDIVRCI